MSRLDLEIRTVEALLTAGAEHSVAEDMSYVEVTARMPGGPLLVVRLEPDLIRELDLAYSKAVVERYKALQLPSREAARAVAEIAKALPHNWTSQRLSDDHWIRRCTRCGFTCEVGEEGGAGTCVDGSPGG